MAYVRKPGCLPRPKRYLRIPPEIRREVIRLAAAGKTYREILEELDVSVGSVNTILKAAGGRHATESTSRFRLGLDDRIEIALGIARGDTYQQIGDRIGRHRATVWHEVARHGGRDNYRPMAAQRAADRQARRPKATRLAACPRLARRVIADLERMWSPQQISRRLRDEFGDDPSMQISHETIYQSLYVQGRGELRKELHRCLRTGRAVRKPRRQRNKPGQIRDMIMISERPAEAADRAVPGHWEGDLIIGKNGKSQIGTLVERTTRFVMLLHLPTDRSAETVRDAMANKILTLPAALRRSITWDQGVEMAQHAQFTIQTGIPIYFCDPHAPWQRGSNENTNGLLRQFFPKGTDLSIHTTADLDRVADLLNGRPRQTLNWKTPSETLNKIFVAMTG